jgi:hypothetical protein
MGVDRTLFYRQLLILLAIASARRTHVEGHADQGNVVLSTSVGLGGAFGYKTDHHDAGYNLGPPRVTSSPTHL